MNRVTEIYRVPVGESDRIRAGLAMQLVALATGVTADRMTSPGRGASSEASRARWLAMYVTHIGFGWPIERVGHAFGFSRATVAVACRWVEDARDRRDIDALVEQMETVIRNLCTGPAPDLAR